MVSNHTGRIVHLLGPVPAVRPVMADVLRRDHSPVMAEAGVLPAKVRVGVLPGNRRAKVRVGVLPGNRRAKVRAGVLPGNRRAKERVGVLPDNCRAKERVGALLGNRRAKVRVGVLPGNRRAKERVGVLPDNQAAVDALRDRHPVVAAEEVTAAGKVATEVKTTSSSSTDNRGLAPIAGSGAGLRLQKHGSGDRNITGLTSPAPKPPALKNHLPDQAPASTGA
jgi:hypothetical protein